MALQIPPKIQDIFNRLNNAGLPIPMVRDCLSKQPSMTYTLTLGAAVCVLLGCIHATEHLVDFDKSITFLQLVGGAYLTRKGMQHITPLPDKPNQDKGN